MLVVKTGSSFFHSSRDEEDEKDEKDEKDEEDEEDEEDEGEGNWNVSCKNGMDSF